MKDLTSAPVTLAQGGNPQFQIVLPNQPSAVEEFAAEELRQHLYAMIGLGPRLRGALGGASIYLNDRDAAQKAGIMVADKDLRLEAFHLETKNGHVYLFGGQRGILYAVYDLLESLGCRWYTPEISKIPRQKKILLPHVCRSANPAFEFRDTFNWECHDPLWWARNRMNGWYTTVPAYMGGNVQYCGFVHTFYDLLPPDEFFATHPEYFSMIGGVRRREASQVCLTNPDVLRIVTERVLERMRKNPAATIFSVSQNDCAGFCECPVCKAVADEEGAQSGPILRFVNAVAAETSKAFPDKLIDTLAYWYSLDAPSRVVPHPSVRVRVCSINCCQGHGYGTCDHKESARFLRALEGWGRRTPQMYIWHYATNFAHYPLPMPDFDELHANINLYKKHGVYGIFIQGCGEEGGGAESMALRGYVVSRLLWNPDQPVWPLVDEFLAASYGAAAPQVRQYMDVYHQRLREDPNLHPSLYDPPTCKLHDEDLRGPADAALAEAETKVSGKELHRVRLLRSGLTYAKLFRTCGTFRVEGDVFHGDATDADLQAFDGMAREWKRAGMQHVREGEAFDVTVQKIRNRLSPHGVERLKAGDQTVVVAPDLGGRLLEWHAHGRQWLAAPDPDNTWQLYPMSEGYSEFVIFGLYGYQGWCENHRHAWRGDTLMLTLIVNQDLHLNRTLRFSDGTLHLRTHLVNRGKATVRCAWGAGLHLSVPGSPQMSFKSRAGEKRIAWDAMPEGLGGATTWSGDQAPDGEWRVEMPEHSIAHRFTGGAMDRAIIGKVAAKNMLALDVRSTLMTLEPKADVEFKQELRIVSGSNP